MKSIRLCFGSISLVMAFAACGPDDGSSTAQTGQALSFSQRWRPSSGLSQPTVPSFSAGPLHATQTWQGKDWVMALPTPTSEPLDPVTRISNWSSPATLRVVRCVAPSGPGPGPGQGPGACGYKPVSIDKTITWHPASIERRKVVPSAKVRFGPFTLKHSALGAAAGISDTYRISVWARSPAVYAAGPGGTAQFQGAQLNLVLIGETIETLSGFEEREVYVVATLPGVFTAIQLRASIGSGVGSKSSRFPATCSALPPSAGNPAALDAECMQAAVNPLAVLDMRWIPLAILYEPPGNCSWSNLTQEHTAGAAIAAIGGTSTSSNTISDRGFFWDNEHTDYTSEQSAENSRRTEVRLTRSESLGTRFGLPRSNPGNPQCNVPGAGVPARPDGGPGRGDVFVLLRNASMIYWDTANMTGSIFSPVGAPNSSESMVVVTAQQIRSGSGLPPGVSFTDEERDAILALSPFAVAEDGTVTEALVAPRFLALGEVIELGQGLALEHSQGQQLVLEGSQTLTRVTKDRASSSSSDLAVDLSMKALTYGGSALAAAGAGKILTAIGGGFAQLAGSTEGIAIPELFKDQSETTVVTSYGKTSFVQQVSDSTVTQQFYLQDTTQGISVALYYDALFGTYVFAPHTPGSGWVLDDLLHDLPALAWTVKKDTDAPPDDPQQMPAELHSKLEQLGAVTFEPAPESSYRVTRGATRVVSPALTRQAGTGRPVLPTARLTVRAETPMQTLYIARNAKNQPVAQLWVTLRATPPRR